MFHPSIIEFFENTGPKGIDRKMGRGRPVRDAGGFRKSRPGQENPINKLIMPRLWHQSFSVSRPFLRRTGLVAHGHGIGRAGETLET